MSGMTKEEFFNLYDETHKNKPINPDIIDHGMDNDVEKIIMSPEYINGSIDKS